MTNVHHRTRSCGAVFHEVAVIQGSARRRSWTWEDKARIVAESLDPEVSISAVARRYGLNPNQLFTWRRQFREDGASRPLPFEGCVKARQDPEATSDRCSIEIVIGGMTVRVGTDVDEGALRRVLSVVRSLP